VRPPRPRPARTDDPHARSATPWYGPYSAAKAGLHSLAETLDMELRPLGVRVLLLALGTVRSTIGASSAALHDFAPAPAFYDAFRANINARVGPQGAGAMPADEYARRVADAAFAPSPPQYLSFGGFALIVWLLSWIPRRPRLSLIWKMYSDKT
jgi:1-acylglycerone phosphate reductase